MWMLANFLLDANFLFDLILEKGTIVVLISAHLKHNSPVPLLSLCLLLGFVSFWGCPRNRKCIFREEDSREPKVARIKNPGNRKCGPTFIFDFVLKRDSLLLLERRSLTVRHFQLFGFNVLVWKGGVAYWSRGWNRGRGSSWFLLLLLVNLFGRDVGRLGNDFDHPAQHPERTVRHQIILENKTPVLCFCPVFLTLSRN